MPGAEAAEPGAGQGVAPSDAVRSGAAPEGAILTALHEAVARLRGAGVPSPEVDAELLIAEVLGCSRGQVQLKAITGAALGPGEQERLEGLLSRRLRREPLQHITGRAAFRSLELRVGPGVFVPRPETETVVQHAIDALNQDAAAEPLAIDLGTGSGAIALAMATEVPRSRVWAIERSADSHAWAQRNFAEVAAPNATLLLGDLADAAELLPEHRGRFSVVISNPPYIPDDAVPRDPEVRLFDPEQALYGGPDGLDAIRVISRVGMQLLRPGGVLVLEHAESQGEMIRTLLDADGWQAPRTWQDLSWRDRSTTALR